MSWLFLLAFSYWFVIISWLIYQHIRSINSPVQAHRVSKNHIIQDYLAAVEWLAESALLETERQWNDAQYFLSGQFLHRHRILLEQSPPPFIGILRSVRQVSVQTIPSIQNRCLIVDQQSHRRMATYAYETLRRCFTQDLGDATVVIEMKFDRLHNRWKLHHYIQEIPGLVHTANIDILANLPSAIGRDS